MTPYKAHIEHPFNSRDKLKSAVDDYIINEQSAQSRYGDISTWDVSLVTDMSGMFDGESQFNQDISNWDVSNVESMTRMFYGAKSFNQPIGSWDVSSVENMSQMFYMADSFDQDISNKQVQDINGRYYTAWDVGNVTDMDSMFYMATNFDQDISSWDVSKVTNHDNIFEGCNIRDDHKPHKFRGPLIPTPAGYQFNSNDELKSAVDEYMANKQSAISKYGIMNTWDVSRITDICSLQIINSMGISVSGM